MQSYFACKCCFKEHVDWGKNSEMRICQWLSQIEFTMWFSGKSVSALDRKYKCGKKKYTADIDNSYHEENIKS